MPPAVKEGSLVRLVGLVSFPALNGAEGVVVSGPAGEPPRYPVRLLRPEAAAAAHSEGVRVQAANIQLLDKDGRPVAGASAAAAAAGTSAGRTAPGGGAEKPAPASAAKGGASKGGAAKGGGGKAAAGGSGGAGWDAPIDPAKREEFARMSVKTFLEALDADVYPMEVIERMFGIQMNPSEGKQEWDMSTWPMGNLTLGAWITIRNWYLEDKIAEYTSQGDDEGKDEDEKMGEEEFGDAWERKMNEAVKRARKDFEEELVSVLLSGLLPSWYQRRLLALAAEGRASAYAAEIIRRDFAGIPWNKVMLGRVAGLG